MEVPDVLEQHGAGHHLVGVLHQVFEQPIFARLQVDRWPARSTRRLIRSSVRSPTRSTVSAARRAAADQRAQPGVQLGEGEGLDHVVVAAGVEALDPVVEAADRGQEQDGRGHTRLPRSIRTSPRPSMPGSIRSTTITS